MSPNTSSYLAGVGTVVVLLALGFGAGTQMTGMLEGQHAPNKLERRAAEQADATVTDKTDATVTDKTTEAASETKPAGDVNKAAAESRMPAQTVAVPVEPAMVPAQRMKQAFVRQPLPAAPSSQAMTEAEPRPVAPQPAAQANVPEDAYAKANDADIEKTKLAAEQKQKMQHKKLAAERRRQRDARLNAAADWVRRQPLDIARPPRSVAGNYFFAD